MSRFFLPLFLLIILVLEGTAMELLPESWVLSDLYFIPHWVLVFIVMIAIFYDYDTTYYSVMYGIIFGLFIDIIYTDVLGIYMFTYGLVAYLIHTFKKILHANLFVTILLTFIGVSAADSLIYLLYSITGITSVSGESYAIDRLIPTLFANIFFMLIIYPFFYNKLQKWSEEQITKPKSV